LEDGRAYFQGKWELQLWRREQRSNLKVEWKFSLSTTSFFVGDNSRPSIKEIPNREVLREMLMLDFLTPSKIARKH
jgi:hypothetical protein